MPDQSHSTRERIEHLQFPGESDTYRTARNALLDEEMQLRRQIERVAAQRRRYRPAVRCAKTMLLRVSGPTIDLRR